MAGPYERWRKSGLYRSLINNFLSIQTTEIDPSIPNLPIDNLTASGSLQIDSGTYVTSGTNVSFALASNAIEFDAASEGTAGTGTISWTHTPVGTPKGVVVGVSTRSTSLDEITAVTYGGVAMTLVDHAEDTAGEQCRTAVYFLGTGIPTGAQTVSVTVSGSNDKWAACETFTAPFDTQVGDFGIAEESQADPSVALSTTGPSFGVAVLTSGSNAPGDNVPNAGYTESNNHDFALLTASMIHADAQDADGTFTIGWTSLTDDVAMVALAIEQATTGYTLTTDGGTYTLTGDSVALLRAAEVIADSGTYTQTGTDISLERSTPISAESGSYGYSGTDISLARGAEINADTAAYTITGTAASLDRSAVIVPGAGSYAISGTDAGLVLSTPIAIDGGSYSISGADAGLELSADINIDAGSYSIAGTAASLELSGKVAVDSGAYGVSGTDVGLTLQSSISLSIESGAYSQTGADVGFVYVPANDNAPVAPPTTGGSNPIMMTIRKDRKVKKKHVITVDDEDVIFLAGVL